MAPTVVVALDGSTAAETALPFAIGLAKRRSAELMLTSVVAVTGEFATWLSTGGDDRHGEIGVWVEDRRTYLKSLIDSLPEANAHAHVSVGRPTNMLVEFIDTIEQPIVVLASHGREQPESGAVGRHTLRLLHLLAAPVVVIKSTADGGMPENGAITRVLVPLDGSDPSVHALDSALEILGDPAPSVHLVSVIEHSGSTSGFNPRTTSDEFVQSTRDAHAERLDTHARALTERGHVTTWEVRAGDPEVEIVTAATDSNASMIAMATHGHTGSMHALLGSVAEGVLHQCRHPLLLIRPDDV